MEVKDFIACYLSQQNVDKDSIIAILCNCYAESGFKVGVEEYSGGGGFGLWQWTGNYDGQQARAFAAQGHSEEDNIKFQCDLLLNNAGQWIAKSPYNFDWNGFLKNVNKLGWADLTTAFCVCWERPANMWGQGQYRQNNYNLIQPVNFCNGTSSNAGAKADDDKSNQKWTIKDCMDNKGNCKEEDDTGSTGEQSGGDATSVQGFAKSRINANFGCNKETMINDFSARSSRVQAWGVDVNKLYDIVLNAGVSPEWFFAYELAEQGTYYGWLNHTYYKGDPYTDAQSVCEWIVECAGQPFGSFAWTAPEGAAARQPALEDQWRRDYPEGTIGHVYLQGTAAAVWEMAGVTPNPSIGKPMQQCVDNIIKWGGGTGSPKTGLKGCKPNDGGTTGENNAGWNPDPCYDWLNKYGATIDYSMSGLRAQVLNGTFGDCSSFVSAMLSLGYADVPFELNNTESLHGFLQAHGFTCIEEGNVASDDTKPTKGGDVYIFGLKGYSAGAGGHTGIAITPTDVRDLGGYYQGVTQSSSGHDFVDKQVRYHGGSIHWYHYSRS